MVSGGMSCVKYLLFAFNLVFVIFGILLIYGGFTTIAKIGHYEEILVEAPNNVAIALIIVGFAIFIIAFFGCCGAIKENSCMLSTFSVIIFVILLIELVGAGLIFAFKSKIRDVARDGIIEGIKKYDESHDDAAINKALDDIQKSFSCCGADNFSDWTKYNNFTFPSPHYPWSCCPSDKLTTLSASAKASVCTMEHVYKEGCIDKLIDEVRGSVAYLGGVAIAVAVIQLIGIIFACSLSRSIRREYEVV